MAEISADDLVIYKDGDKGVYSGGYSIDSILLKSGLPAITTIHYGGGSDVATPMPLFQDLVVPNWAFSGNNNPFAHAFGIGVRMEGGKNLSQANIITEVDADTDTLYDKLLHLASNINTSSPPSKILQKSTAKTRKRNKPKINTAKTRKR